MIGELTNLILVIGESWGVYTPPPHTHYSDRPDEDEDLTPSLENMVVLTRLRLLHKDLPRLIKQRYGTELRFPYPSIDQA